VKPGVLKGGHPGEHRHRDISDGLVTNVSLILGMAGAHPAGGVVRLAGLAGLVAGAFSMAAGEYVSMQAQRELMERELAVEAQALSHSPDYERDELRSIYEKRGIDATVAKELVNEVMQDPTLALETHAREELGIDPQSMGSPPQAAASSFIAFALGAVLPLIPWLITSGGPAVVASISIGAVAAVIVGAVLGVLTGRSPLRSALRQLFVVTLAAAVTYGIGRLIGVGVH
jgi:VIT1/CCC1 family predicted Fe2+/Mn2+ transporter